VEVKINRKDLQQLKHKSTPQFVGFYSTEKYFSEIFGKNISIPPLTVNQCFELKQMPYSQYSIENFVTDEDFIRWVKYPDEINNAFWNSWISQHPHKRANVYKAREIILLLDIRENLPDEGKFLETWERIAEQTDDKQDPSMISFLSPQYHFKQRKIRWYHSFAATLVIALFAIGGYSLYQKLNTVVIRTAYGESRSLFLPDGTKVMLNVNSSLQYTKNNFQDNKREVWLEGEAFFTVVHKSNNENFKVHTNELEVEVLGTRFDVHSRRGKTKVVLEEGKVKLDMTRSAAQQQLVMHPGDFVAISKDSKIIQQKLVNPKEYLAWRNNRFEFNGTSLREIGSLIEDNYGYQVVFVDEKLGERKFTGSSAADNLQELTQKLSTLFELRITQERNVITIDKQ
jgi:transmembrane sensor